MKALILALTLLFFSINTEAKTTVIATKKKQINTVKAVNIKWPLLLTPNEISASFAWFLQDITSLWASLINPLLALMLLSIPE